MSFTAEHLFCQPIYRSLVCPLQAKHHEPRIISYTQFSPGNYMNMQQQQGQQQGFNQQPFQQQQQQQMTQMQQPMVNQQGMFRSRCMFMWSSFISYSVVII